MSDFTLKNGSSATIDLSEHGVHQTVAGAADFREEPLEVTNLRSLTNQGIQFEPEGSLIRNIVDEALRGEVDLEFLEPISLCFFDMDGRSQCSAMRMEMEFLLEKLGIDTSCDPNTLPLDDGERFAKLLAGNLTLGVHGSVLIQDGDEVSVRHLTDSEIQERLSFSARPGEPHQTYDYAIVYPTSENARIYDSDWEEVHQSQEGSNIARFKAATQACRLHTCVIDMKQGYTPTDKEDKVFGPLFRVILADQMFRGNVRINENDGMRP